MGWTRLTPRSFLPVRPSETREIVLPFSPLSSEQFNKIRRAAEKSWKNETRWSDTYPTTYGAHFRRKKLDEPPSIQPFSETRVNNPHPHELFLVNNIHYLPGYYNSKTPAPEKNKVSCPEITTFFKDSMNIKRRVMHQVVTLDICLPARGKNVDHRAKSAVYNSPKSSSARRRAFTSQVSTSSELSELPKRLSNLSTVTQLVYVRGRGDPEMVLQLGG